MKSAFWEAAAAECRGELHEKQNLPMQDAHKICFFKGGFIAAVSDGLGSKKHSDFGSKTACRIFVKTAKKWEKRGAKSPRRLIKKFCSQWQKKIEKSGFEISDCAATFLGTVCTNKRLFLFRLGDGMNAALLGSGESLLLSDKKSESFSNVTACLKKPADFSEWEIAEISREKIESVFLCTDGISDDLAAGVALDFVRDLASQYKILTQKQMQKDMDEWVSHWDIPRHTDDKTAVFIRRKINE